MAGQLPYSDGWLLGQGVLGRDVDLETGRGLARHAALNALAVAADAVGGLDQVRIVQMLVFVASTPEFGQQSKVADAASELLIDVLGENGRHARTAIGVASLPLNSPVEIQMVCTACRSPSRSAVHRAPTSTRRLVDRVDTPAPIVLADVMQRNIDRMQAFAAEHGLDLRPHVKTHKCVEVGRRQVEAGAVGITAGNVGEAEVFAAAGFDDIFLAYPVWPSGTKGDRIRRLAQTTRMRVGVDNVAAIEALADAMGDEPDRLQVVVEVDCGARRSGAPPAAAGDLALAARKRGLVPVGVYTYPGHGSSGPGCP